MATTRPNTWAAKREGTFNRFYTRTTVGDVLIEEIGDIEVANVVDLGAGEGSLSAAVARRWPTAHITTVDIDHACVPDLHETLVVAGATNHEHRNADVLDFNLAEELGGQKFDLAVCNPPFFRPPWKREFADILQSAEFANACRTVAEATAEILFFAQNLRVVRDGGTIALIVPDSLATGWRAKAFRRALLDRHTINSVVQLPPYSFHDTEAYCFILIITKGKAQGGLPIKLLRLDEGSQMSKAISISSKDAEIRLDWAYHSAAQTHPSGATTLRQLAAEIRRGSLSTVERRAADFSVFHTGDFPRVGEQVDLTLDAGNCGSRQIVMAEPGDILMARVDRDLHQKITFVASGRSAITDCIYRVRLPEQYRRQVFEALSSEQCRARIQAVTKGVGARLLGKGELLDIPLLLPRLSVV